MPKLYQKTSVLKSEKNVFLEILNQKQIKTHRMHSILEQNWIAKTANFRSPAGPALELVAFWSRLCSSRSRKLFIIGFYDAQTRRNPFARQTPKFVTFPHPKSIKIVENRYKCWWWCWCRWWRCWHTCRGVVQFIECLNTTLDVAEPLLGIGCAYQTLSGIYVEQQ